MTEEEQLKKYNRLYLEIIMRYKDYIEDSETIYVAELPKLVTPTDESVVAAVKNITGAFPAYNYDQDFYDAVRQAHKYVKDAIATVTPPVEFWLKPSQVIAMEAGDTFDKAVLLCSMLIALGNLSAKIVTVIRGGEKKFLVYCEFKGKIITFDIAGEIGELQSKEELIAKMGVQKSEDITAYEFNDKMYNDLA